MLSTNNNKSYWHDISTRYNTNPLILNFVVEIPPYTRKDGGI